MSLYAPSLLRMDLPTMALVPRILLVASTLLAGSGAAYAQVAPPHLSLDRFQPTGGSGRILAVPTSATMPLWNFTLDVALDYARAPLGSVGHGNFVDHQATGQILAAIGFVRVDLGLAVPGTLYQSGSADTQKNLPASVKGSAMGDLRLHLKVRLTPEAWKGGIAAEARASFPTGDGARFSGEDGYGVSGRLIGDVVLGRVQLAGYFGYRYRTVDGQLYSLYVSDELMAGLGLSVNVVPKRLWVFGNLYGDFGFRDHTTKDAAGNSIKHPATAADRPLEWLLGLEVKTSVGVVLSVAGGAGIGTDTGAGLTSGYGSPQLRVLGMVGFDYGLLDRDRDGIADYKDKCPAAAGPESTGGCPLPPPAVAVAAPAPAPAPVAPAPVRKPAPPAADDGAEPEDGDAEPAAVADGGGAKTGGPGTGTDGAGQKGGGVSGGGRNGARRPAADQNRVASDEPARAPKPKAGSAPSTGSGSGASGAPGTDGGLFAEKVYFRMNRAMIDDEMVPVLELVVHRLHDNPNLRLIVEGHADDVGPPSVNHPLSLMRAETVQKFLQSHGITASRIDIRGFGSDQPLVKPQGPQDRAINRRAEFRIVN